MKQTCARILLFGLLLGIAGGWFGRGLYESRQVFRENLPTNGFYPSNEVKLIRVVDGDTIEILFNGTQDKVRFLYINTPERGKPGYKEAKIALNTMLAGKKVTLEFPRNEKKRGNYGRLLAYVIADDINTNIELVRQGWSAYWTKYGRSEKEKEFIEAERHAKKNNLGIWKK